MTPPLIPEGFCLKCRGCCRFSEQDSVWVPTLLDEEAGYGGKDKKIKVVPGREGFICSYLEESGTNQCRIYSRRPFECWLYPFLINCLQDRIFLAVDRNCVFVEQHAEEDALQECARLLKDFLEQPQQQAILKRNPQALGSYGGVDNLLPLEIKP